jgi:hypothetical protein
MRTAAAKGLGIGLGGRSAGVIGIEIDEMLL